MGFVDVIVDGLYFLVVDMFRVGSDFGVGLDDIFCGVDVGGFVDYCSWLGM